jgi:hypothetical protein
MIPESFFHQPVKDLTWLVIQEGLLDAHFLHVCVIKRHVLDIQTYLSMKTLGSTMFPNWIELKLGLQIIVYPRYPEVVLPI